jgi:hypothetical protein
VCLTMRKNDGLERWFSDAISDRCGKQADRKVELVPKCSLIRPIASELIERLTGEAKASGAISIPWLPF